MPAGFGIWLCAWRVVALGGGGRQESHRSNLISQHLYGSQIYLRQKKKKKIRMTSLSRYSHISSLKHISIGFLAALFFLALLFLLRQTQKSGQEVLIGSGALLIRQERVCVCVTGRG